MKTPRWMKTKRSQPDLPDQPPIWLGNHSNGEYFHYQTDYERKLNRLILEKADENARKIGVPRREFLASAMGMATTLWCVDFASGCSSNEIGHNVGPASKGDGGLNPDAGTGGRPQVCKAYNIQPELMYDEKAACAAISGNEFIFDIQTHFFETDGEWITRNPGYVTLLEAITSSKTTADFGMNHYLDVVFCKSDTKVAVLSCWPGQLCSDALTMAQGPGFPCGIPMSADAAAKARDTINLMANSQRMLAHAMLLPTDPTGVEFQKKMMETIACTSKVAAWKMYPAAGGYFVDNPDVGIPLIEKGLELGVRTFCIHKGLLIPGFDWEHNQPEEIGRVAKAYPDGNFVVYHASIQATPVQGQTVRTEGPYIEGDKKGVNAMITAMRGSGIGPNQNVYAELGSSWRQVMMDGKQATHYIGKLLKYVGENNVLWGTDALVGGTPQGQIETMRAFKMDPTIQAQEGYPDFTDDIRAKIFGRNSAAIYGIDPNVNHCQITCPVAELKEKLDEEYGNRRWVFDKPPGPSTYEEYVKQARENIARGYPG
jgi:predicted TIM-barrel fold metal-dependent hydrolase